MPSRTKGSSAGAPAGASRVRLKPQDSFDLIRLIARSQSDARKALGELVQNSLEARARHVDVTWFNERGVRTLRIRDDGEGIFPGVEREEALRKIAQTIGASHKKSLSPAERHKEMVLGKYGIGLLGFWCVGRVMEIKSRVAGGETWVLRLEEDRPEAEVFRARGQRAQEEETFTEITVRDIKESVARQIRPARLQAYLASELRGQLLQREVEIRIHDRVARGRSTKEYLVRPKTYLGLLIEGLERLEIPGHEDARVELYFVPEDEERRGIVALSCGGTTVLDDIALVDPTDPSGGGRAPWTSGRFEGVVDFPEFDVAPGTRRGFVPNEAALDFLIALEKLETALAEHLSKEQAERTRQRHESVAREIRRAFAPMARRLPDYDLFDVRAPEHAEAEGADRLPGDAEPGSSVAGSTQREERSAAEDLTEDPPASPMLFPPGPLHAVELSPANLRLQPSTERRVRARALDADGRAAAGSIEFQWSLAGAGGIEAQGSRVTYRAPDEPSEAQIVVVARDGVHEARASATIRVQADAGAPDRAAGIPEPVPINAPSEPWRSRMRGERWEYNEGHRDYLAVRDEEARRLRYLIHLFAKEVVLKNFGSPLEEELLERMIEVLTHLGDGRGR